MHGKTKDETPLGVQGYRCPADESSLHSPKEIDMTANATVKAATTRKAATKAAPKAEVEAPRADLQDKAPSELHKNLLAFAKEQTGIDALDLKTVQVVLALHGAFQKSEANQAHLQDRKSAWAAKKAERDAAAAEAKKARLAKLAAELGVEVSAKA